MNSNKMLSASETAKLLGISTASVRNWIRHGYLTKNEQGFSKDEVESLLVKIRSGEIDRLNRRANKRETAGTLAPDAGYADICRNLISLELEPAEIIWLIAAALFRLHGLAEHRPLRELLDLRARDYINPAAAELLRKRLLELTADIDSPEFQKAADKIEEIDFPDHAPADANVCGIIYQSVCRRGSRSASGSFYTPPELADELIQSALRKIQTDSSGTAKQAFIDPCCGSGQFILSFIKAGGSAERAVGIDSDPTAAFIAAMNILLQCPQALLPKIN